MGGELGEECWVGEGRESKNLEEEGGKEGKVIDVESRIHIY